MLSFAESLSAHVSTRVVLDVAPEEPDPEADASSNSDVTVGTSDEEEWHITHATADVLPSGDVHCATYPQLQMYGGMGYSISAAYAISSDVFSVYTCFACKRFRLASIC